MIWLAKKIFKRVLTFIILLTIIIIGAIGYFNFAYPLSYENLIGEYSTKYGIDPYLVAAIINVESNYDKNAISHKEARGLMQISETTGHWASEVLSIDDFDLNLLFEPKTNIMIGTWYLNVLSKEFNNNIQLILAAYNGGSGNVTKWLNNEEYCEDGKTLKKIPFEETEEYVQKVLKNEKVYKVLYKDRFDKVADIEEKDFLIILHSFRKIIKNLIMYK